MLPHTQLALLGFLVGGLRGLWENLTEDTKHLTKGWHGLSHDVSHRKKAAPGYI